MNLKPTLIVLCLTTLCTLGYSQGVAERCERHTTTFQGLEREYYLYRPAGLPADAPLVLILHGYGGSALKGKTEMMDVADTGGFAVCYPQGVKDPEGKTGWNVGYPPQEGMKTDDVKFICALARKLQKEYSLSRSNTFLSGMSNGGEMCYLTAMRRPRAFKAYASIAGLTMRWMTKKYSYKHPVAFMEVHGTEDRTSEWLGDPLNKGGWGGLSARPGSHRANRHAQRLHRADSDRASAARRTQPGDTVYVQGRKAFGTERKAG